MGTEVEQQHRIAVLMQGRGTPGHDEPVGTDAVHQDDHALPRYRRRHPPAPELGARCGWELDGLGVRECRWGWVDLALLRGGQHQADRQDGTEKAATQQ